MASRQGRIALQLTQWVGGTIILLMFVFILADYAIQRSYFQRYVDEIAIREVTGLRNFVERQQIPLEDTVAQLQVMRELGQYAESSDRNFAVFDEMGNILVRSPWAMPSSPVEAEKISRAPSTEYVDVRRVRIGDSWATVAVTAYETRGAETPSYGTVAFIISSAEQQQMALTIWGLRSLLVLGMIIATMLAVRIPVKRFVVRPIDGLFMAAYAASRDDFQKLPPCPCDNEFADLYDMFNRLLGHLSDTRVGEGPPAETEEAAQAPEDTVE